MGEGWGDALSVKCLFHSMKTAFGSSEVIEKAENNTHVRATPALEKQKQVGWRPASLAFSEPPSQELVRVTEKDAPC